jgi:erythromycin esterase
MKGILFIILILSLDFVAISQNYGVINDLDDVSEFKKLDSLIKGKKYIFLGENNHYVHEYSQIKYTLIKYLHEKHNFNVILFESGMADCYYGNSLKYKNDSTWLTRHSIYPVWWSEPTISLMNYVKQNNLNIGGVDYQPSSSYGSGFLKLLKNVDTSLINETYYNDSLFSNFTTFHRVDSNLDQTVYDSIKKIANTLTKNYTLLNEIIAEKSKVDSTLLYYKKVISNRLFLLNNFENTKKMYPLRDSVMADNIVWFCDSLYPNEKIIIWGANDHIAKARSNFGNYYAGAVLPDRIKKESYYVGLYGFSGELYNYQDGKYTLEKPNKKSLEGRLHTFFGEGNSGWIDFNSMKSKKSFKWLNKTVWSYALGKYPVKIIPVKFYDGIIFINKLSINH